jgi:hypothetical protein
MNPPLFEAGRAWTSPFRRDNQTVGDSGVSPARLYGIHSIEFLNHGDKVGRIEDKVL